MNRSENARWLVQQANHLPFGNNEHGGRQDGGRRFESDRLTGERPLTHEIAGPERRDDRLLSRRAKAPRAGSRRS